MTNWIDLNSPSTRVIDFIEFNNFFINYFFNYIVKIYDHKIKYHLKKLKLISNNNNHMESKQK